MKTKRRTLTALALVALAALVTIGIFRVERPALAQDEIPPPQPERISFGMVGITAGQTVRISVANTIMPNDSNWPPGPSRVVLNFRNINGQLVRDRNGEVIRKMVDLERGDSTFLDLNGDDLQWPPGPTRLQLRAVVTVLPPPSDGSNLPPPTNDRTAMTVEVINNANGRTAFAISAPPAIQMVPPPTPD